MQFDSTVVTMIEMESWTHEEQLEEAEDFIEKRLSSHSDARQFTDVIIAAARVVHRLFPAEEKHFELWVLVLTYHDLSDFVEWMRVMIDDAINDETLTVDNLESGDDLVAFLETADSILVLL